MFGDTMMEEEVEGQSLPAPTEYKTTRHLSQNKVTSNPDGRGRSGLDL